MVSWHEGRAHGAPTDFHIDRPGTLGIAAAIGPLDKAAVAKRENGVSHRVHGVFAGAKNAASIRWSTPEQRNFMTLLELDPDVSAYTTAPAMKLPPFRFNIPVGQWIDRDGKLLRFAHRGRDRERRLVFEGTDNLPDDMTDQELLALQQASPGRLKLLTTAEAMDRINEVAARPRVTALDSEHDGDRTRMRLDYIRGWERCGRPPRTERHLGPIVLRVLDERRAGGLKSVEAKAPSPRQVLRWISDWLESGGNIDALVPQDANRGNWNEKRDPAWHELLEKTVAEKYLVDTRPTAVSVHAHVIIAFGDHNAALPADDHLPVPSLRSVYREIEKIDAYSRDCSRLGRRAADIKWRPKESSPATTRHNEVWEVDHTTIDAIVTDRKTGLPIGRPTVTCIIDRHTRCIVGIHIGFDAAGTFPMMQCLRNAIQGKDALLASVPEASGPWPCFGTCDVLMADQGREFKSQALVTGCRTIGTDIQYAPVLKAWYKGKIERFFRTLSRDVFHRVPGTTFANFFARNKENTPDTVAFVTLDEMRMHTVRYIVDVYHKRKHRGLGMSPLQAWAQSVAMHGMRLAPDPERVLAATSHSQYRTPQHYGIEFEGLIYNSPDVAAYRIRPKAEKDRAPVRILVDPLDLTEIRFLDPATNKFFVVPIKASMLALLKGVTLEKHKMARALQLANEKELGGEVGLARAYTIIDRAMDAHGRQGGMANRREATRYWEAIISARPPEDTPAFDTVRSASPITDGLFDEPGSEGEADAPGAGGDDVAGTTARRRKTNARGEGIVYATRTTRSPSATETEATTTTGKKPAFIASTELSSKTTSPGEKQGRGLRPEPGQGGLGRQEEVRLPRRSGHGSSVFAQGKEI